MCFIYIFVWPLSVNVTNLPFFYFISYRNHTDHSKLSILNILAQVVFTEANHCVWVFVWNSHTTHRDQKRKQTLYCEPRIQSELCCWGGLSSNMFSATWRPNQHCNARNSIWSAWPPSLDHGWCLSFSPSSLSICAWGAAEPCAPINPMVPGWGWYGDHTRHGESCDSQVKGGIDFLIRSSTQIELQLNFRLSPSLVAPHDKNRPQNWRQERENSFFLPFFVSFPVSLHHSFISLSLFDLTPLPSVTVLMVFLTKVTLRCSL